MIIDVMDLLYFDCIDVFVLVLSDSDFIKLVLWLRELEKFVFGVGEKKILVLFWNVCDDFIFIENLGVELVLNIDILKVDNVIFINGVEELIFVFLKVWELYQNDDGWVDVGLVGSFFKWVKLDFDFCIYGFVKFIGVVVGLLVIFEMIKQKGKGMIQMILYCFKIVMFQLRF